MKELKLNAKPFLLWWGLLLLVGLGLAARAERRPATVVALEEKQDCRVQVARIDSQRFEAEKEIARLRGALKHMQSTMRREHTSWNVKEDLLESPVYGDLYRTAEAALAGTVPSQAAPSK